MMKGLLVVALIAAAAVATGRAADASADLDLNDDLEDIQIDVEEPGVLDGVVEEVPQTGAGSATTGPAGRTGAEKKKSPPRLKPEDAQRAKPDTYLLEAASAVVLALYLIVYLVGASRNRRRGKEWATQCADSMANFYAEVGKDGTSPIEEAANEFVLYGTGRQNCRGMHYKLELPANHDLVSRAMNLMKVPTPDRYTFSFDLMPEAVQGFIVAVMPTRQVKRLRHNYDDLRLLTKTLNGSKWGLPQTLAVSTDCPEAVGKVLTEPVVAFLKAVEPFLEVMLYSDMFMGEQRAFDYEKVETTVDLDLARPTLLLKFSEGKLVDSPSVNAVKLLRGAVTVLDVATSVQVSASSQQSCKRKRDEVAAAVQAEDESKESAAETARDRVLERQREEKERYEAMDENNPARKAYEKKLERKQAKKKSKGGVKMVKR